MFFIFFNANKLNHLLLWRAFTQKKSNESHNAFSDHSAISVQAFFETAVHFSKVNLNIRAKTRTMFADLAKK